MTLPELLSLNSNLSVALLQSAYEEVVAKLRLNAAAFPAVLTGSCRVGGFSNPAYLLSPNETATDNSQVCFKQIRTIEDVNLLDELEDEYTIANLVLGDQSGTGFGFDDFDEYNDEFETTPSVYWSGQDIVCTNLDSCFVWLTGWVYPYFVNVRDETPYTLKHVYSISGMQDLYVDTYLEIDPLLMYPVVTKALSLFFQDTVGDLFTASGLDNLTVQYINTRNQNPELLLPNIEEQTVTITANTLT